MEEINMYYLIQKNGVYSILEKETVGNYNRQYHEVEMALMGQGLTLHGQFGRLDYATRWMNYYNTGGYKVNGPIKI